MPRRARPPGPLAIGLRRYVLPVAGTLVPLALIVGLIFAVGGPSLQGGGDDNDSGSVASDSGDGGGASAGGDSGGGAELVAPDPAVAPPAASVPKQSSRQDSFVPGQRNRRIERSFSLELGVPAGRLAGVADEVARVTDRHGGFVLSSSIDSGEDEGGGQFSLRIPADRLRPALRDLAGLATVIRQSQEGRDVTRQHVTAKDRLQAARAERNSLLRRLEEAATDEEAEAIRVRLDLVAGEISGLRAQLRDLRLRTDYAVVDVSLEVRNEDEAVPAWAAPSTTRSTTPARSLVGLAGVLIRVLALAVPLGLLGLAGWGAATALRRRRRESALV